MHLIVACCRFKLFNAGLILIFLDQRGKLAVHGVYRVASGFFEMGASDNQTAHRHFLRIMLTSSVITEVFKQAPYIDLFLVLSTA